ncbi:MAG: hypothetical protein ABIN61_04055 [candidate division WOR-3 bacterium]
MKKGVAIFLIFIAFFIGVGIGYFFAPYISKSLESYREVTNVVIISSLKENMRIMEIEAKKYAEKYGHYPKNSSVSWLETPLEIENPITYKRGEGEAYTSGKANKPGIIGFESDINGTFCKITGYGVNDTIKLYLGAKASSEEKKEKIDEGTLLGRRKVEEDSVKSSSWDIIGIHSKIVEKNIDNWKFFWEFTVYNQEKNNISFSGKINFINKKGITVTTEILENLEVPGASSKTFNGYTLINADLAAEVEEVDVKLKREKFVRVE